MNGPVLLHERLDYGFAMLAFVIARTNGAKDAKLEDFLPRWDAEASNPDSVFSGFQKLLGMAKRANDRNPDR